MTQTKCADFEARIESVGQQIPGQPRQQVILTRLLYSLFRDMNDQINGVLHPHGLNTTTLLALCMIYARPGHAINPLELSHSIYSSRTNITRLADELVQQGWVERHPCPDDRRKVILQLTDAGRALVETALPQQWNCIIQAWGCLTEGESALLQELLTKVLSRVSEKSL